MQERTLADLVANLGSLGQRELFRHRGGASPAVWTYERVGESARRLAAYLQQMGLARGDCALLWGRNSPEWAIVFLGCLLSGIIPVPIDLRFRPSFVQEVRRQTKARLLFAGRSQRRVELGIPRVTLEELEEALQGTGAGEFRPTPIVEDDVAEILYTSGTTAEPKGVTLTHRNLVSELQAFQPVVPWEPEYRFLSVLPLSHIFEQMGGLLLPITRGGTVVYIGAVSSAALLRGLREEHPMAMMVVPRLLALLHDRVVREVSGYPLLGHLFPRLPGLATLLPLRARRRLFWLVQRELGGSLKYLVSGGAALEPRLERFWEAMGMVVLQGYGLTETASAVSCNRVDSHRLGSVGRVLENQEVCIAADGEILVRGPNVTPGYYGRPAETAEAFVDGWLKTGDIGHFDRDGFLFIRGRKKRVIVTAAGINVHAEDVERALAQAPGVRDSVALEWQGEVHAVLLLEEGADARRAVRAANTHLDASQKIRHYTVWPYPDLPRTPTMKIRQGEILDYLRQQSDQQPAA